MFGSAIFAFEGVGIVLPVAEVTKNPEQFSKILTAVLITTVVIYTSFGEFCYAVWGDDLEGKALITEALPPGPVVWTLKLLYCINVVITIALQMHPANSIVENYVYKDVDEGERKTWFQNLLRVASLSATIVIAALFQNYMDKFSSLIGTLTAAPVTFLIPCMMHQILVKPTGYQKALDIFLCALAIGIVIFFAGSTLLFWTVRNNRQ
jgi:proton-coupled amino acid transporter